MTDAVSLVVARLTAEEGYRAFCYDDATAKAVTAPVGKLTVGYGCNLTVGISRGAAKALLQAQVAEIVPQLNAYAWYSATDPVRQSVLLDVAFNDGVSGLLGFTRMIAAVAARDWKEAAGQLLDSKASRDNPGRYGPLADLFESGGESDV